MVNNVESIESLKLNKKKALDLEASCFLNKNLSVAATQSVPAVVKFYRHYSLNGTLQLIFRFDFLIILSLKYKEATTTYSKTV